MEVRNEGLQLELRATYTQTSQDSLNIPSMGQGQRLSSTVLYTIFRIRDIEITSKKNKDLLKEIEDKLARKLCI